MEALDQEYSQVIRNLRKSFRSGKMRSLESRLHQLQQLHLLLEHNEDKLFSALKHDLHKHRVEANLSEFLLLRIDIANAIRNLKEWNKPERVKSDLVNTFNTLQIRKDPLGVVLVIGAWNFPLILPLMPVIGALASGNCIVIKPSELSEKSSNLLAELVPMYLDQDCVQVINGGVPETEALLRQRFDHIFYTGSPTVGKIVMRAAAEHLTPVTLELGGKCPAVIDETCNLDVIAQRIAWGKFTNSGQACLAVDYILCIGDMQEQLIQCIRKAVIKFYGENPRLSEHYGRIINKRHFGRICKLIDKNKVVFGGDKSEEDLYISPTIMANVTAKDQIMQEEIFGPVLPILVVNNLDEAIDFINDREKPLALYVFSNDSVLTERLSNETSSGGMVVNDVCVHYAASTLPFGGVGQSGMGAYHGKFSFDTFIHRKAYLAKSQALETANALRYPPYVDNWAPLNWLEWLIKPSVQRMGCMQKKQIGYK